MRHSQDRTINLGGRVDPISKLYGGIGFTGNSTVTVIAAPSSPTRITSTPAYSTLLTSLELPENPYWELAGTTADAQVLRYLGSKATFTVHWGVTIEAAAAADMQLRLVKAASTADPPRAAAAVMTELSSVSAIGFNIPARYTTLLVVDYLDEFYIDIANLTAGANVTVTSSQIVFTQ